MTVANPFSDVEDVKSTEKTLKVVDNETLTFEGRVVDGTSTKITGLTSLDETNGLVLHTDDRVRLIVETRVTGVNHAVDKDGQLIRTHLLKVLTADPAPWDPTDEDDDGVLRA
jgi:hypothetical protein